MNHSQLDAIQLPEIRLSADLKLGRYRITPTTRTTGDYRLKNIGIYINDEDMVRILLTPEPWARTHAGELVLGRTEEIVVEIIRKKREFREVQGRIRRPVFEYEGKVIENLSSPEKLFEYEITEKGQHEKSIDGVQNETLGESRDATGEEKADTLRSPQFHPMIPRNVWSSFSQGAYDSAVFEAFKQVEIAVRRAGGYADDDIGTKLMRQAFHVDTGNLTNQDRQKAEKQACSDLFAGAIGYYKNPRSHREVEITAKEAIEVITLASLLLWIVDSRTPTN